jgi:DNA-binding transcriptional MerR regulator
MKYIKIKDAALILGVSRMTLRNWDKSGKLKANRHPLNNYRVYKVEDIEGLLESIESSKESLRELKNEIKKLSIKHLEEER